MTVTPTPDIDPIPDVPQRLTDTREQFVAKMDAMLAAWPTLRAQMLAVGESAEANAGAAEAAATAAEAAEAMAIGSTSYGATTAATLNLALTSQGFTLQQTGKGFAVNDEIALVNRANRLIRMRAILTAFNAGTGVATATITKHSGNAASAAGWVVTLSAYEGLSPDEVAALSIAFAVAL